MCVKHEHISINFIRTFLQKKKWYINGLRNINGECIKYQFKFCDCTAYNIADMLSLKYIHHVSILLMWWLCRFWTSWLPVRPYRMGSLSCTRPRKHSNKLGFFEQHACQLPAASITMGLVRFMPSIWINWYVVNSCGTDIAILIFI